jgi:hypothetical protein
MKTWILTEDKDSYLREGFLMKAGILNEDKNTY